MCPMHVNSLIHGCMQSEHSYRCGRLECARMRLCVTIESGSIRRSCSASRTLRAWARCNRGNGRTVLCTHEHVRHSFAPYGATNSYLHFAFVATDGCKREHGSLAGCVCVCVCIAQCGQLCLCRCGVRHHRGDRYAMKMKIARLCICAQYELTVLWSLCSQYLRSCVCASMDLENMEKCDPSFTYCSTLKFIYNLAKTPFA